MKVKGFSKLRNFIGRVVLLSLLLILTMSGCKKEENESGGTGDVNSVLAGRSSKLWIEIGANSSSGGGISNDAGKSLSPAVAVWRMGNPVVCWSNSVEDNSDRRFEIYVKRWNGSAWIEMGTNSASGKGISDTIGDSTNPKIVINREGTPIICWKDQQKQGAHPIDQIFVKRWNGSSWVEMGRDSAATNGISENESYCSEPSMAIDSKGNPIVCWAESAGRDAKIRLKRWDGRAWVEIESIPVSVQKTNLKATQSGAGLVTSVVSPEVQIVKDGNSVVCWADTSGGNSEIYVKQWNGKEWKEMGKDSASNGGISGNAGSSVNPAIAVDWGGMPIICWEDETNGNSEIYVRQWNGFDWVELSGGSASEGGISNDKINSSMPNICINQEGAPVISWIADKNICLSRWNGSSWMRIGEDTKPVAADSAHNDSVAGSSAIAIDSEGNSIVVFDSLVSDGNSEIYVRKYPMR